METYPILETFLFLITARRLGGVGAQEGREKVPDHIFPQIKKKDVFLAEDYGINRIFPQNCVSGETLWIHRVPKFSAKYVKVGLLTCDFLGVVEG